MDESEVLKFEQVIRPLKLSEAIRIGSMLRKQSFYGPRHDGGSCALIAACEATGLPYSAWMHCLSHAFSTFPDVPASTILAITRKNDDEKWTREQIADWLESEGY